MEIIELTSQNFAQEVLEVEGTVLIDFWAPWCGPCRMLSPIIDEIAQEGQPGLKVCKVNIDEQPELAQEFQVMSIPTLLVFRNGMQVNMSIGLKSKAAVLQLIKQA